MLRLAGVVGAVALVMTGCAGGGNNATTEPDPAGITDAPQSTDAPDNSSNVAMGDVCDLYDGINVEALIHTAAGELVGSDDECSVAAADPLLFAQSNISVGNAPAMIVIRSNFEGPVYDCPVVDLDGLGDDAFTCLGGTASSFVVFTAGEYLVIFSAGNNVAGPPVDSDMLAAAQQVFANMAS